MLKTLTAFFLVLAGVVMPWQISAFEDSCLPECYGYGINPESCFGDCDAEISFDFLYLKSYLDSFCAFAGNHDDSAGVLSNNPNWDYGFNVGVAKGFCSVPFVTKLSWMHFETEQTTQSSFPGGFAVLMIPTGNFYLLEEAGGPKFDTHLHFNQVAFEIFQEVYTGPKFTFSPSLGVEYIDLGRQSSASLGQASLETFEFPLEFAREDFETRVRGFGPSLSFSSAYLMDCGLRFDGGVKGALFWSQSKISTNVEGSFVGERLTPNTPLSLVATHKHHILRPELLFHFNIAWVNELAFCGSAISLHAGWQGLFLFGSDETLFNFAYGRTFNLQGFAFGANVTF